MTLAHFPTDTVKQFLVTDFMNVIKMEPGNSIDCRRKWLQEYINVFTNLKIDTLKKSIYNCLYENFGFNYLFRQNDIWFKNKQFKEDSINSIVKQVLQQDSLVKVETTVLLDKNSPSKINNFITKFTVKVKPGIEEDKVLEPLVKKLISNGINKKNIIASTGFYSHLYTSMDYCNYSDQLMDKFLDYISTFPEKDDVKFIENLIAYGYFEADNDQIKKVLKTAVENIK